MTTSQRALLAAELENMTPGGQMKVPIGTLKVSRVDAVKFVCGGAIPQGRSAIAEVYPALWNRSFAREGRTGDQHDAYSIAAWLSQADLNDKLGEFFNPSLTPSERTTAQVEGWILGVA